MDQPPRFEQWKDLACKLHKALYGLKQATRACNNIVSWCSKKQHIVSRSTTEAKYKSLANATFELIWIPSLLIELKIKQNAPRTVWCDNLSIVACGVRLATFANIGKLQDEFHNIVQKMAAKSFRSKMVILQLCAKILPSAWSDRLAMDISLCFPPCIPGLLMAKDFKALVLHVFELSIAFPRIPNNSPQSRIALVIKNYQNTKT
ncbi:Retrovirus-related Pol polyprotein from transposon RE2 [Vitis vinifera]|uniref:Retrovirus-related Pol polyprotein from transposon RE2 n=1 Tax=Vitis vinifera TaxID=29760 RepID=A0A438DWS9_VITVI|nr:Retrovirus-related Pol polyprotein from transposon RE2 [Vitis vinifera]